jgi:cellulose synthase/poly-beta-1,6-N-acetylglucosamine synthase-like glycosyltransferase
MSWIEEFFLDFTLTGIWGIVFIVFGAAWLMMMLYYWLVFSRLAFYNPGKKEKNMEFPSVSIVIAARNEYTNLSSFLPEVLEQDYPEYEVIVVNDASDDDSVELLDELKRKYPHLNVLNLRENINFFKGKKFPLSLGIRSAKYEHLLLTDADCRPSGKQWIKTMMSHYRPGVEIVLGYGKYAESGSLLNLLQRYDTLFTAMQYFSLALAGMPYMGVGRNLSYKKQLFNSVKGFSSHYRVQSGDDDLFINKVAQKSNTAICTESEGHTISQRATSFARWIRQKRRHMTTGKFYKSKHKFLLGLLSITRLVFWGTLIALLIRLFNTAWVVSAALLMLAIFLLMVKKSMSKLKEKKLFLISPILDILLLVIYLFINFANLIRKPDKWK